MFSSCPQTSLSPSLFYLLSQALPFLESSNRWYHTICVWTLTRHNVLEAYLSLHAQRCVPFTAASSALWKGTTFCSSIHQFRDTGFQFGAVMNNASVNILTWLVFWFVFGVFWPHSWGVPWHLAEFTKERQTLRCLFLAACTQFGCCIISLSQQLQKCWEGAADSTGPHFPIW